MQFFSTIVKYSSWILLWSMMILGGLGVYAQNTPSCPDTCILPSSANTYCATEYDPDKPCIFKSPYTSCPAQNFCTGSSRTNSTTTPPATNCEGKTWAEKETCEKAEKKCVPTPDNCCGIKLNTNVPFIGNCIEYTKDGQTATSNNPNATTVNSLNAFPLLIWWLSRILLTVILVGSFVMVIAAGVMMAAPDALGGSFSTGQSIIRRVVAGIALLGASGIILNAINPNFFK